MLFLNSESELKNKFTSPIFQHQTRFNRMQARLRLTIESRYGKLRNRIPSHTTLALSKIYPISNFRNRGFENNSRNRDIYRNHRDCHQERTWRRNLFAGIEPCPPAFPFPRSAVAGNNEIGSCLFNFPN